MTTSSQGLQSIQRVAASRIGWRHLPVVGQNGVGRKWTGGIPPASHLNWWREWIAGWRHPEWIGGIPQQNAARIGRSSGVGRKSTGGIPNALTASRMNWRHPAAERSQNRTEQWGWERPPKCRSLPPTRPQVRQHGQGILGRQFLERVPMGAVVAACNGANRTCGRGQYDPAPAVATVNNLARPNMSVPSSKQRSACPELHERCLLSAGYTSLICTGNGRSATSKDAANLETPPAGSPQVIPDAFLCGVPPSRETSGRSCHFHGDDALSTKCTNGSLGDLRRAQFGRPSACMAVGNRPVDGKLRIKDLHIRKWTKCHVTEDAANLRGSFGLLATLDVPAQVASCSGCIRVVSLLLSD
ncbi:hypothetical protein Purlil1_13171 [Purpureocillium lilacinum]|uniref:Uncharacterized protein n=1 Tax=Purpureocillium lilacinum TaxID=33203 RepID=A0ABR0BES3_PURLI|nr:hypothetical protein Purlil1_13171 [Purpureocillium lilacinum]